MAEIKISKNPVKSPFHISISGWKSIVLRVKEEIDRDNVPIVSAGVAFYAFLAIFPALAALISIYGLAVNPQQVESQLANLATMIPEQAFGLLKQQIENFMSSSGKTLGWGMAAGILFSLWSANKGTKSLFTGLDIAYGTKNTWGFIKKNAVSLLFTLGSVILLILSMALLVAFPAYVAYLQLPDQLENITDWLRWVILAIIVVYFLCMLYKVAPARWNAKLRWVLPGAILATIFWLLASWGFSFYVKNFGSYGEVYGSISAVVVLMLWLYITSLIILLGAELNAEIEYYALGKSANNEKKETDNNSGNFQNH